MTRAARFRCSLLVAGVAVLAGCAEVPTAPSIAPRRSAHDEQVSEAIARHRQQALQQQQSGAVAAASVQWQIVALVDPRGEAARGGLAATQAAIPPPRQENLHAGVA